MNSSVVAVIAELLPVQGPRVGRNEISRAIRPRIGRGLVELVQTAGKTWGATSQIAIMLLFSSASLSAQPTLLVSDFPSRLGAYHRAYLDTNGMSVATWTEAKGGPYRWDFSTNIDAALRIQRTEIVAPTDDGHGSWFSAASFAEKAIVELTGATSWSYYRVTPGQGREYFGSYDNQANPASPESVFAQPTTDFPETIVYGQKWQREVDFPDLVDIGVLQVEVSVHFTCQAEVDAYGRVILPGLGEFDALRITELNSYDTFATTLGMPLGVQYFRNYYWLVKDLGKVVHLISRASTSPLPEGMDVAATVLRVFESSEVPQSVGSLRISGNASEVRLDWKTEESATQYRVEAADQMPPVAGWSLLSTVTEPSFVDPVPPGRCRFYRVWWAR